MVREEKELNDKLKKALNIADVSGMLLSLRKLADIKEEWNKEVGFEDSKDLIVNSADISALRRTTNLIEWLDNYR
jgi:hypothetical protein